MEEQRLADRRLHRFRLEGLGDQEGRLRTLAGQQAFREGGDEDHRHVELGQDVLDRIDARAVIGKLNIGEDETGTVIHRQCHRLVARHRAGRRVRRRAGR